MIKKIKLTATLFVVSFLGIASTFAQSEEKSIYQEFTPEPEKRIFFEASPSKLYIKGAFNNWSSDNPIKSDSKGYSTFFPLSTGTHELIINDFDNNLFLISENTYLEPLEKAEFKLEYYKNQDKRLPPSNQRGIKVLINENKEYQITISHVEGSTSKFVVMIQPKEAWKLSQCETYDEKLVSIPVSNTFSNGQRLREYYSNRTVIVNDGFVSMDNIGQQIYLLEETDTSDSSFNINSSSSYFVFIDRFKNGNSENDLSYGRFKDGKNEIGTFHGGDLQGVIEKVDYISNLGVDSVVLTAPFEQIHGWVGGGSGGDFPHFGYHGYYTRNYTKIDANFGTEQDLEKLTSLLHGKGIKLFLNIVLNHPGYATLKDMQDGSFGAIKNQHLERLPDNWTDWKPQRGENWHSFNDFIDFSSPSWDKWWGKDWVRAGIHDYPRPGRNTQTLSLFYLPDFKTESTSSVSLPLFLQNDIKASGKKPINEHLISWVTQWVRDYGIDGFLIDAEKHVEPATWQKLSEEAQLAYSEWYEKNLDLMISNGWSNKFYMVGERFGHMLNKSDAFNHGFDSMLNFSFQQDVKESLDTCFYAMDSVYQNYSNVYTSDDFGLVSYLSSHDTYLNSKTTKNSSHKLLNSAYALTMSPGPIQLLYGDEINRQPGPRSSDKAQATRSSMPWELIGEPEMHYLYYEWSTLLNFRKSHPSIGLGVHKKLRDYPYTFSRTLITEEVQDKVIVAYYPQ